MRNTFDTMATLGMVIVILGLAIIVVECVKPAQYACAHWSPLYSTSYCDDF